MPLIRKDYIILVNRGRGFRRRYQKQTWKSQSSIQQALVRNMWKNSQLKMKTKMKIFKSNVVAVLLYGCETWRMTKRDANMLDVFLHKSLRRIMKIYWPMKTSNEEIRNRANISTISEQIFRRRWKFISHILRRDPGKHSKTANRGRPN